MHVVVAMSGGVDSSVAALRLLEDGHEVTGVFLRNGIQAEGGGGRRPGRQGCCSVTDAVDAEEVAGILGIPYYSLDHEREFRAIIDGFVADYADGRTPNPCVLCNRDLKFGELWRFARSLGADAIATGHYARVEARGDGSLLLRRAVDAKKDQSYVLAVIEPSVLRNARFPLGELTKPQVRALARARGLPVGDKAESQEICFVPTGDHRDVLRARRPDLFSGGEFVDESGTVLGHHGGAAGFTVGQRRGLGLSGGPWFVIRVEPSVGRVVVGRLAEARAEFAEIEEMHWLRPDFAQRVPFDAEVQVRAHHSGTPAAVISLVRGRCRLQLSEPLVLTPGQYAVLYAGDTVVGAGRLSARERAPTR